MRARCARELLEAFLRLDAFVRERVGPVAKLGLREMERAVPAEGIEGVLGGVERTAPIAQELIQFGVVHRRSYPRRRRETDQ